MTKSKGKGKQSYLGTKVRKASHRLRKVSAKIQNEIDRRFMKGREAELILQVKGPKRRIKEIKYNAAEGIAREIGAQRYHILESIPFVVVQVPKKEAATLCSKINNDPKYFGAKGVVNVKRCNLARGVYTPELALRVGKELKLLKPCSKRRRKLSSMWNLDMIGTYSAQEITRGRGSTVLVIDTGVEYGHKELKHLFDSDKGYNFVADNDNPKDDNGHGTHVCGTVGSNSYGVATECRVLAAKVLDGSGYGLNSDVIRAIDMAIQDDRVDIATMSLGSSYYSDALEAICSEAYNSGVIVTAAAGNEYYGAEYPAACTGVISVAAVDYEKEHAEFSNIDPTVDISAPGVSIESTYLNGGTRILDGTSMATPHVAGIGALSVSAKNGISPKDFEKSLKKNAEDIGRGEPNHDEKYGAGLARADLVLENMSKGVFRRSRR